jgi:hypothetical protein
VNALARQFGCKLPHRYFIVRALAVVVAFPTSVGSFGASAPTYISSMADFEVRQMSGSFAPSSGGTTMRSVTPSEWISSDPGGGVEYVLAAWSGGGKGVGTKLIVHGGGHNDSANNGVYVFDFAGTTRPAGWVTPLDISSTSSVRQADTYSDGRPSSAHTYDGMVYVGAHDSLYRFGGAKWSTSGGWYGLAARYSLATRQWSILPSYPGNASTEPSVAYDPVSNKILVTMTGQSNAAFFRVSTNSWSSVRGTSREHHESALAYDHTRNRGIMVGGGTATLYSINWSAETFSESALAASGSIGILSGGALAAVYDSRADAYWIWGGRSGSSGYSTIYRMNANTFATTAHALSQSMAGFETGDYQGSFCRFILLEDWRAIGFLTRTDAAPFVIKLPEGALPSTNTPRAPTSLTVQ